MTNEQLYCQRCTHYISDTEQRVFAYGQILCLACHETLNHDPDMDMIRKRFDKCLSCKEYFTHQFKPTVYCGSCEHDGKAGAARHAAGIRV